MGAKPKKGKSQNAALAALDDVRQKANLAHRAFVKRKELPAHWTEKRRDFIAAYQALWRQLKNPSVQMPQDLQNAAKAYAPLHGGENFAADGEAELETALRSMDRFVRNGEAMTAGPPVSQAEWSALEQAYQYVLSTRGGDGAQHMAFKGMFVSRYQTVMTKLGPYAGQMPARYRTAFLQWYPQYHASRTAEALRKRGPEKDRKKLNEAERELESMLDRFA
ncbi:MAG TPA: hypothetical protein VN181_03410 [Thermoanaerobaculia bacterium]|nr:hypothetical protein [Thermoanaerobaculia bacterium]